MIFEMPFWSSDILTGNQTRSLVTSALVMFWSSDILTGNQTSSLLEPNCSGFGAVTF